jgi:glycosyltransferase involved in cell wall biosynthesis
VDNVKISLITVCRNAAGTISRCIESVISQDYNNFEYIVIDGASSDDTVQIVNQYKSRIGKIISEPDQGIYDAMNKGIKLATGNIIGMLNADDYFADHTVLSDVAAAFVQENTHIAFGDIDYVNKAGSVTRKWRSGEYSPGVFNWGWMPPHPTFYCKQELFNQFGLYSLDYGTAADYELMLRFMHRHHTKAFYIKKVMVKMQGGGASNKNIRSRSRSLYYDFKAMQQHKLPIPAITAALKPIRKVLQYI